MGLDLQEQLVVDTLAWLESGRRRYAQALALLGLTPTFSATRWVAEFQDAKSTSLDREAYECNSFEDSELLWKVSGKVGSVLDDASRSVASRIYEEHDERCNFWDSGGLRSHNPFSGQPVLPFSMNPPRWIEEALLLRLLRAYITALPAVSTRDDALAEQLVRELLTFVSESDWRVVVSIPLENLWAEPPTIQAGHTRLRRLSPQESGYFIPEFNGHPRPWGFPRWTPKSVIVPPNHVLEVETFSPKSAQPNPGLLHRKVVLAFQLLGFEPSGVQKALVVQPAWLEFPLMSAPMPLPDFGISKVCTPADLERAMALANEIPDGAIEEPGNYQEVALHRFGLGASRNSNVDSALDFIIALEAILLEKSSEEIGLRFRLHGALLLGDTQEERETLYQQFQQLYGMRSTLVHGFGKFPTGETLRDTATIAKTLSAAALRKCLTEGWPSREDFKRLTFQGTNHRRKT